MLGCQLDLQPVSSDFSRKVRDKSNVRFLARSNERRRALSPSLFQQLDPRSIECANVQSYQSVSTLWDNVGPVVLTHQKLLGLYLVPVISRVYVGFSTLSCFLGSTAGALGSATGSSSTFVSVVSGVSSVTCGV